MYAPRDLFLQEVSCKPFVIAANNRFQRVFIFENISDYVKVNWSASNINTNNCFIPISCLCQHSIPDASKEETL